MYGFPTKALDVLPFLKITGAVDSPRSYPEAWPLEAEDEPGSSPQSPVRPGTGLWFCHRIRGLVREYEVSAQKGTAPPRLLLLLLLCPLRMFSCKPPIHMNHTAGPEKELGEHQSKVRRPS